MATGGQIWALQITPPSRVRSFGTILLVFEVLNDSTHLHTYDKHTGVGISWVGMIPSGGPRNQSNATYSIDNAPPILFNLNGLPDGPDVLSVYEQTFFSVPGLSPGPHSLHVVYDGTPEQTPLTLSYMILMNSTLPSPTSSLNSSPSNTSPIPHQSASTGGRPKTGAIAGGIIAGVAVVILASLSLFFFLRRRRRKREMALSRASPEVTPYRGSMTTDLRPKRASAPDPPHGTVTAPHARPYIRTAGTHPAPLIEGIRRDSGAQYPQGDGMDTLPPSYSDT
jgi:LPXTG-motif cell wall-anchored protein